MKKNLMLYVDIQSDNIDFIVGTHGYYYKDDKINISSSKRPNNTKITDVGYVNVVDLNKIKHKLIEPEVFIDRFKRIKNVNRDMALFEVAFELFRYLSRFKIDTLFLATNNISLIKLLKDDIDKNRLNYAVKDELIDKFKKVRDVDTVIKYKRVYDYETNAGLYRALNGIEVARVHNMDLFYKVSDIQYYWKTKQDRHLLLNSRHMLFVNKKSDSLKYTVANYKKDDPVGLRTNYVVYSTSVLTETIPIITKVKSMFLNYLGDSEVVCTINLDNLYNANVTSLHSLYGDFIFNITNVHYLSISTIIGLEVAHEVKPVGLAGYGIENANLTEKILKDYLVQKNSDNKPIYYIDITDKLFDLEGKCTIKKELADGDKIKLSVSEDDVTNNGVKDLIKLKLVVGLDMPNRNLLKKLEKKNPKVLIAIYVISGIIVETYSILDIEALKECMVWSNIYSNKIPLEISKS